MVLLQRVPNARVIKLFILPIALLAALSILLHSFSSIPSGESILKSIPIINKPQADGSLRPTNTFGPPNYKPTPTWAPPPAVDPFPLLANSAGPPPPIPTHNIPRKNLYRDYGLSHAPPLFIGFTRQWAILLQAVVSYITAGWPPESIIVVENTGVQNSNADGLLTLQNPFYLNHTTLRRLGVTVLQTPVLLSFSQMQNFFLTTARSRSWPQYFYSHQDVLVFSFEDGADPGGRPGDREWEYHSAEDEAETTHPVPAGQPGYLTLYERCVRELNRTLAAASGTGSKSNKSNKGDARWAFRWFQYDHLALVNAAALDAVGGWDSMIPYYMSDCDLNARLVMEGWNMKHRRVGIINDIASTFEDLSALYRVPGMVPRFIDPNPFTVEPPTPPEQKPEENGNATAATQDRQTRKRSLPRIGDSSDGDGGGRPRSIEPDLTDSKEYFRALVKVGDAMGEHKYGNRGRNTWQMSQRGGFGEPFYYDPEGFSRAFEILTEAGREIYRQKWGHRDCDLVEGTGLRLWDQWRVGKDWDR